ncbi:MAG: hypothetical protein K6D03_05670 [Solobacterium sp.]|nr:hypothetical protein [Solobacterium sp.]
MPERPQGRKRTGEVTSGGVNKRGEGRTDGKVGSADYSGRENKNNDLNRAGGKKGSGLGAAAAAGAFAAAASSGRKTGYGGNRNRNGGGGLFRLILIIFLVMLLMNFLGMCGGSGTSSGAGSQGSGTTAVTPTPKPTPAPTANPISNNTTSVSGSWVQPTTTYTDTNTSAVNTSVVQQAREKYTKLKGNGQDTVTMMVYLCGTDLESNYGMATSDLNEMLYADLGRNVNIIVESGGTKKWQNSAMSTRQNQRWRLVNDGQNRGLQALANLQSKPMTGASTLSDFIRYGAENYPADRYILILWDHGGGSIAGYAHDQLYPNGSMTIDQVASALKDGGIKFDIIGFDACLMQTAETAVAVEPYADYLIASEETEPGTGWYYTNWLTALSGNTSIPTTELSKIIIDDFVTKSYQASSRDKTSLSIVDLAEFAAVVPAKLSAFAGEINNTIKSDDFKTVANARSVTKEFAQSNRIDQIDLVHFCKNIGTKSAKELADAVQSCVKYNRCNNMTNAYGMSIYFPYKSTSAVSKAAKIYENIDMDENYTSAIRSFATLAGSGQVVSNNSSNSLFDILGGAGSAPSGSYSYDPTDILNLLLSGSSQPSSGGYGGAYGNYYGSPQGGYSGSYYGNGGLDLSSLLGGSSGVDSAALDLFSALIGRNHVDSGQLVLSEKDGKQVLRLGDDQWSMIENVELNVWFDDGAGYIDLGLDNIYSFDEDGDLVMEYDGLWNSINGHVVSYYMISQEDTDVFEGFVPAELNGEKVNLIIRFEGDNPGVVLGAQKIYEDGIEAKGLIEIKDGDRIEFLCDYYTYDGDYQATYYLGEPLIVEDASDLKVGIYEIEPKENEKVLFGYRLTDAYNAYHWTPMIGY